MEDFRRNGHPHPILQLEAIGRSFAARLGVSEVPYWPPSEIFYNSNYILDGCVAADIWAAFGYHANAAKQLNSFRKAQRSNGMVPGVSHPAKKITFNPERWLSTMPFDSNDYTQSPVWARSVLGLHNNAAAVSPATSKQEIDPDAFLEDIYPDLRRYYDYFTKHRQVAADDPRVFIIHPHEANRDSGPEYDQWKRIELNRQLGKIGNRLIRQPRTAENMPNSFNLRNRAVDYIGALAINLAGYRAGWDPARIHQKTEFVDTWFNCLLYESYEAMAELAERVGNNEDKQRFSDLAENLGHAITNKNFFADSRGGKGAFYSTYNGMPELKDTVGNLLPVLIKRLPHHQLRSILKLREEAFNPNYPLPSVATDDTANYDPHYEEYDRHWRGPTWTVANRIFMRGLEVQMERKNLPADLYKDCFELFHLIHSSNHSMVEITGDYAEHHNPITAKGQRMHRTRGHVFGATAHLPI